MYKDWMPAEATLEICGRMTNVRAPSKVQLKAFIDHVVADYTTAYFRKSFRDWPIRYIVDAGANIGGVSLLLHNAFPDAAILALEPMAINYNYLLYNSRRFPNIHPKKLAVFNRKGELRLSMPSVEQRKDVPLEYSNSGLFTAYGEDHDHSEFVDADTLDNIVDARVDVLKLDIEGCEGAALDGAQRIMTEDRPLVIMEIRKEAMSMAGLAPGDYENYFNSIGYGQIGTYKVDALLVPKEKIIENRNSS